MQRGSAVCTPVSRSVCRPNYLSVNALLAAPRAPCRHINDCITGIQLSVSVNARYKRTLPLGPSIACKSSPRSAHPAPCSWIPCQSSPVHLGRASGASAVTTLNQPCMHNTGNIALKTVIRDIHTSIYTDDWWLLFYFYFILYCIVFYIVLHNLYFCLWRIKVLIYIHTNDKS